MGVSWNQQALAAANDDGAKRQLWERYARLSVYDAPRRARYPALTRTQRGMLVCLFTRQSEAQEAAGFGEVCATYSRDEGQSWTEPVLIYEGTTGEPRCLNTLTTLRSGRLLGAMAELSPGLTTSTVRLLSSDDAGRTWQIGKPIDYAPLVWASPCGRIIEMDDGTLVMSVFGASSQADLEATIHGCGLLRSRDGGRSWGEFTWIAQGNGPMIGVVESGRFSFEGPGVLPLADGRWLAMLNARKLEGYPGSQQVLCRSWSTDEGQTWTQPDLLTRGAWPGVAAIDEHTTICAHANGWGPWEHFGLPSALGLDKDLVMVLIGRPQRGSVYCYSDPFPGNILNIPMEQERIEAVFYRRLPATPLTPPVSKKAATPSGHWIYVEDFGTPRPSPV